ncbi:glycerophosphoryl diester phosphodiesterase [Actinoplanes philippinensis]|uniref:Glycerophosphoryl diester phosphodiesterase n=1 Tax=Actinoplanes philippinensis TaxID=35752 RepID=A0A1I2EGF1_9ACTN|nr:glycerophosphodiester phosphodiesterase family protein [Actinoplanes philippinensis]GIE77004.1 glycerophosphoryl diester phosphodiesterase [Actinoplanes philippinensis]SFE92022.1 glycerophosphoryl diester phosphodiesterase [Actinoplanes philippinensis]
MREAKPRRWVRRLWLTLAVALLVVAGLWAGNSSALRGGGEGRPSLLAHRGLAQTFPLDGVGNDTCTATRIHPPGHTYVENTIVSMRAAFDVGADMVEFDVQLTADGQLAVFHDPVLECRTDGTGRVADHTLAELRRLDLGYGYTADNGATHPLRGTAVGLLPTAQEVVAAFPGRELLIDLKDDDPADGTALAGYLATLPAERLTTISVYGGDHSVQAVRSRLPQVRATSRAIMKDCLVDYLATGWTGHVADSCRRTELHLPRRYGQYLWGWPNLFVDRMRDVDTRVILVGGEGDWSEGFDQPEDLDAVPSGWSGWLWTNRTDVIAPLAGGR